MTLYFVINTLLFATAIVMGIYIINRMTEIEQTVYEYKKLCECSGDTESISNNDTVTPEEEELSEILKNLVNDNKGIEKDLEDKELDIHLITPQQFHFDKSYEKYEMIYHEDRGDLSYYYSTSDDPERTNEFIVDNVKECIGDGLSFFGMYGRDADLVFVRNNVFKADFVIRRVGEDD